MRLQNKNIRIQSQLLAFVIYCNLKTTWKVIKLSKIKMKATADKFIKTAMMHLTNFYFHGGLEKQEN